MIPGKSRGRADDPTTVCIWRRRKSRCIFLFLIREVRRDVGCNCGSSTCKERRRWGERIRVDRYLLHDAASIPRHDLALASNGRYIWILFTQPDSGLSVCDLVEAVHGRDQLKRGFLRSLLIEHRDPAARTLLAVIDLTAISAAADLRSSSCRGKSECACGSPGGGEVGCARPIQGLMAANLRVLFTPRRRKLSRNHGSLLVLTICANVQCKYNYNPQGRCDCHWQLEDRNQPAVTYLCYILCVYGCQASQPAGSFSISFQEPGRQAGKQARLE